MTTSTHDYGARALHILTETPEMRDSVTSGALTLDGSRRRAYADVDAEAWRAWAEQVKRHTLTHLGEYLEQAEERLTANGAIVHWAETARDARSMLRSIAVTHNVRRVVKGKSMLSEEVGVNPLLESLGAEVLETDLGEFIIQLLGEMPSHILAPAIHLNLDDVRALFHERLGTPRDASPVLLAAEARRVLRRAFLSADMGITGANFLVAETGSIALIENEGNIRLTTSAPRIHVALVGIEKLLPRFDDLARFFQLTSRAATGQAIGTFASLIHGPRATDDADGPDELHVIMIDNGRSALLADPEAWEALRCVRCGACLNICPVFRQTGGHAYGWAYSGPIGAVLAPALLGAAEGWMLPQASTLCGACAEACPVRIPIPHLLHVWRERAAEAGESYRGERTAMRGYAAVMTRPALYRLAARALRGVPSTFLDGEGLPVVRHWSRLRSTLEPSPKSFRELWEEGIE